MQSRRPKRLGWWAGGVAFLLIAAAAAVALRPERRTPLEMLWDGFARQDRPVLISLPAPTVLRSDDLDHWLPLRKGESIPAEALQVKENSYVGVGAALGAARFAEQLTMRRQAFLLKFGSDVSFADLKQSPALLLGSFTSGWTMEMTRQLRYRLESSGPERIILDSSPGGQRWSETMGSSKPADQGYALITRIVSSDAGHPLLMAAGITALDTQAAVEFLTRESYFETFSRSAPADWPRRNFQVVIRSRIHGHSAGRPAMVASYVW